jgi:hypothetical protein
MFRLLKTVSREYRNEKRVEVGAASLKYYSGIVLRGSTGKPTQRDRSPGWDMKPPCAHELVARDLPSANFVTFRW